MKLTDKQRRELLDQIYEYGTAFARSWRPECEAALTAIEEHIDNLITDAYEAGRRDQRKFTVEMDAQMLRDFAEEDEDEDEQHEVLP